MTYKSCHWVTSGIHFEKNEIRFCCYEYLQSKESNVIVYPYSGEKIDWKKFFEIKHKYITMAKNNNHHKNCRNCIYLEDKNWEEQDFFDHFIFNQWTNCNSRCVYCWQTYLPKEKKREYYDVYPVLKDMQKNKLIRNTKNSCVVFGGGEPTILRHFDKIMELFLNEDFNNIRVNSSCIKYSKPLAQALKDEKASLMVSLDSGTREMYEKIKRTKAYKTVWKNLDNYLKASNYSNNVKVKYIIIPNLNDNKEEINAFLDNAQKHGIKSVALSIEDIYYKKCNHKVDDYIFDLVKYFLYNAEKQGFETEPTCEIKNLLMTRENSNI